MRGSISIERRGDVVEEGQRTEGRPTRGTNEAGLRRIVNGMRAALRSRHNIHVTRKEIAQCAGVTPALVTYYFPEKDSLIEATTVPIVDAMVESVKTCLNGERDPRQKLLQAVDILIASYARDAAIIDLFISYRASKADKLPDLMGEMDAAFVTFFGEWLQHNRDRIYDAVYLQKAVIGMCKIVARRGDPGSSGDETTRDTQRMTQAEAICAMLLEPMAKIEEEATDPQTGSASGSAGQGLG